MKMKKLLTLVLASTMALFCVACSSGRQNANIDISALADKLSQEGKFDDQMAKLDDAAGLALYNLDSSTVAKSAVFVGTGAFADEIAVFEAVNEAAADNVKTAADDRIEEQKAGFEDYAPNEMPKLKEPIVIKTGKYVILCVSADNDAAQKVIDAAMAW